MSNHRVLSCGCLVLLATITVFGNSLIAKDRDDKGAKPNGDNPRRAPQQGSPPKIQSQPKIDSGKQQPKVSSPAIVARKDRDDNGPKAPGGDKGPKNPGGNNPGIGGNNPGIGGGRNPGNNPGNDNKGPKNPGGNNPGIGGNNPGNDNKGPKNPGGNNPGIGGNNPGIGGGRNPGNNPGNDDKGPKNPGGNNPGIGGNNPGNDNKGPKNPGGNNPGIGGNNPGIGGGRNPGNNPGNDDKGPKNPGGNNPGIGGNNPGNDNKGPKNPGGNNPGIGGNNPGIGGGRNPGNKPGNDDKGPKNPGGNNPGIGGNNPGIGGNNPGIGGGRNPGNNPGNDNKGPKNPGNNNPGVGGNNAIGNNPRIPRVVNGQLDAPKPTVLIKPIRVEKNGGFGKHEDNSKGDHDFRNQLASIQQLKNGKQARDQFELLRHQQQDLLHRKPDLAMALDLNRVAGRHQDRLNTGDFRHWEHSAFNNNQVSLVRQLSLQNKGDVARQLHLANQLHNVGGWRYRQCGQIAANYTTAHFSGWYAGPGFYPKHCWFPHWGSWVAWSWWDRCSVVYDPRPYWCRPVYYDPCAVWTVYTTYPTWTPLVQTCGTWVDVPQFTSTQTDLQLLAVRFVDSGHPEQKIGPRFRVWFRNNLAVPFNQTFPVVLLAGIDGVPNQNLPQAGVLVNGIDAGEIQSVDIRLPFEANRIVQTADGYLTPFNMLHVLIDPDHTTQDVNFNNNGAVISRTEILPVDPAGFALDSTVAMSGRVVNLAGEGLGPEPGRVLVMVSGLELQAEVTGWYDLGIQFTVPQLPIAGAVDAEVVVIRGDGAASNPVPFQLVPFDQTAINIELPNPAP